MKATNSIRVRVGHRLDSFLNEQADRSGQSPATVMRQLIRSAQSHIGDCYVTDLQRMEIDEGQEGRSIHLRVDDAIFTTLSTYASGTDQKISNAVRQFALVGMQNDLTNLRVSDVLGLDQRDKGGRLGKERVKTDCFQGRRVKVGFFKYILMYFVEPADLCCC